MQILKRNWHRIALIVALALAGFLSFFEVGREGYANQYYSAAVKSMLSSWHNFFFVSFDPGGYVSVDKPALGLWLQALSAKVFGFHGWSLILPQAVSTVVSVAVLYHLVQRTFGKAAGIASAFVMALTPILIAVSRTNNLDASLVMVMTFAAWAVITASEKGSFKLLLLSVALVGLGFNIKMLEAYMVLPAVYLVYLFTPVLRAGKKIIQLTAATAVLLIISLSWAVIVDFTPADQRPYVGSSKTNSVVELALGYNGIQRLTGNRGNNRAGQPDMDNTRNYNGDASDRGGAMQNDDRDGSVQNNNGQPENNRGGFVADDRFPNDGNTPGGSPGGGNIQGGFNGGQGGPGGASENGQKGILRIFNQQIAGQISWMLPMALFGIIMLLLRALEKEVADRGQVIRHLVFWTSWIVPALVFFSIAGFYHRYYLSMLAPGIAALSGIAIVEMWKAFLKIGWKCIILPAAFIITAGLQSIILLRYPELSRMLVPLVCGVSLVSAIILIVIRLLKRDYLDKIIKLAVAAGFAALLIAPAVWAYTPIVYGSQTTLPFAGPELNREAENGRNNMVGGNRGFNPGGAGMNQAPEFNTSSKMVDFLLKNKQGEKFLVAVSNANAAAPIIIRTGEAVMATGGFSGGDNILTVDRLENMVKNGEIRYFLIQGGGGGMGSQSDISSWVASHGTAVPADKWNETGLAQPNAGNQAPGQFRGASGIGGGTLYDLAPQKGTK